MRERPKLYHVAIINTAITIGRYKCIIHLSLLHNPLFLFNSSLNVSFEQQLKTRPPRLLGHQISKEAHLCWLSEVAGQKILITISAAENRIRSDCMQPTLYRDAKNKWFIYLSLNIIIIDAGNCQRLFVCGMNACVVFEILERDQQKLDSKWHVNDFSGLKNTNVHDQSVLGGVSCGVGIRLGAYVASQSNSCLWRGLIKRRFRFYYFVSSFPKAMF